MAAPRAAITSGIGPHSSYYYVFTKYIFFLILSILLYLAVFTGIFYHVLFPYLLKFLHGTDTTFVIDSICTVNDNSLLLPVQHYVIVLL